MPIVLLRKNYFEIHYLHYLKLDPIHPPHPLHRLLRLELLGDAFGGATAFSKPKDRSVGLFFGVGEVRSELAAGLQFSIEDGTMFPEIAQSPLGPHADGRFFFGR